MAALRKPHRVAFLIADVSIEGVDVAHEPEAALLLWIACIETCRRHPELAVYDAESTPLFPLEGHFVPVHGGLDATPTDEVYAPTRRDELVWLELGLPRGPVRLHVRPRTGEPRSFEARASPQATRSAPIGDQIQDVLGQWLSARGLGPLPRRFDPIQSDELLATIRQLAPALATEARTWIAEPVLALPEPDQPDEDEVIDAALEALAVRPADGSVEPPRPARARTSTGTPISAAYLIAGRLPSALRVPALRLLELAMREPLGELILAADPDHPQALFAKFLAAPRRDFGLLRRVIAQAPGWARPYAELAGDDDNGPTRLELIAGAGMAALCRPTELDIVERAADNLREDGRVDEAVRLMTRVAHLHDRVADHSELAQAMAARAHIALLHAHRFTDRIGAWLAQAHRSSYLHGCPMDPALPWYPDQIQVDLAVADALMNAGRLDEAIALRANRLEGREATWPRHTRILATWRKDPRFVAWCFAREAYFRGDPARTVEGFGRAPPDDSLDLAAFLDALVATGREDEVALAWGELGLGRRFAGPTARLAAARSLLAAGDWRRGLEALWRVELCEPGRDELAAIARCGLLLSAMPLEAAELALAERLAIGAVSLVRRMARDIADFVPGAAKSSTVIRALGKSLAVDFDPAGLAGFATSITARSRAAIDALFSELEVEGSERRSVVAERRARRTNTRIERITTSPDRPGPQVQADRLVNRWLDVVFSVADPDDPRSLARVAAYCAAQALGRYLAATTTTPSVIAGGLRTVAAEALALVRTHADALSDDDARALLAVLDQQLRRVDRWVGAGWLGAVERACGIDERSAGDIAGFVREHATVAARILGPEETAVLASSVAQLHRAREPGWESPAAAQAARLALHTGGTGVDEWADATVAQLAARTIELDDAIDALHTACYLAEDKSAVPAIHTTRVLLEAGRAPAALAVLAGTDGGLSAATVEQRDRAVAELAPAWKGVDVPLDFAKLAAGMFEALQKGDAARAEKLGRLAIAIDPTNAEAHRNLGLAFAQQGKLVDAIHHLVRGSREEATQILSGVLYQAGKVAEAMAVLDYASRWYVRADQWLTYGGIAYTAMDNPRTVKAYALAYELDSAAFDTSQLNAYAGVLDEVGDYTTCELIANHLLKVAGDDVMWKTNGWNHLACAYIGKGRFDEAIELAQRAVDQNPLPDNAAGFAATLERAKARTAPGAPAESPSTSRPRDPAYGLLDESDFAAAVALADDPKASWRARRVALAASRFRFASENAAEVTSRARSAAAGVLADTIDVARGDRDAVLCRFVALEIREQAYFAHDPPPRLGDRMTAEAFYKEFRARGGIVIGREAPPPPVFLDRVVVPGTKVARASDYVALLRDLAALTPREALAQFDLDDAGYLEVARAWTAAMTKDPTLATTIAAGLARPTRG